jgi:D-beta-D-heptose 7-phosphate kinase/D-beta-D-heptose 1-phosphate adenosyltransferase
MTERLDAPRGVLTRFADLQVTVIGEAMLDAYLSGNADRLSREAPVPIVALDTRSDAPGGAGNTAANVRSLGARVRLLSVVGADDDGTRLRQALEGRGVATDDLLVDPARATLAKQRILAGGQMLLRFDSGSTEPISPALEDTVIDRLGACWQSSDAIIVSDYGYGLLTPRVITVIGELQARTPRVLVVDARDLRAYGRVRPSAVKPNYAEAIRLLGDRERTVAADRARQVGSEGPRLLELTGARIVALTLDSAGALVFERGRPPYRTYARPAPHSRAAGAGDTFVGALALALAAGASTTGAAELASAAAAIVVGKDGTSLCSAWELAERFMETTKRLEGLDAVAARVDEYRAQGARIVFTNGCFDILHRGHITYLNRAKALGDVLIVGLNSDDSVRRLKGDTRPINPLDDRREVLEALSCVDHVVPFSEDTPAELIRVIRPHVFAKGGDYRIETLPEAPLVEALGGEVQILPYVDDRSTSGVIARVRELHPVHR